MYELPSKDLLEKDDVDFESKKYFKLIKMVYHKDFKDNLVVPIGITSDKEKFYLDLKDKSGVLIFGETGSGKTNFLNSLIISLLLKNNPDELKFILYDKRGIELNNYINVPHVITNLKEFDNLRLIVKLMNDRRELFISGGYSDIDAYNEAKSEKISNIVFIIDEIGEHLYSQEFQSNLIKILNDGCNYGIHLVLATSSYLKELSESRLINLFNCILTFDLASSEQANFVKIKGANLLNEVGDVLVKSSKFDLLNLQTPFVSENDINNIVNYVMNQK